MKDIRLAASFLSNGGGAMPMNSNGNSWNMDFVTTTGNVSWICSTISTSNVGHDCTSCGFMRRYPIQRAEKYADIFWSAVACMPMPTL